MSSRAHVVLREPLVHFVALGLALFAIDAARSRPDATEASAPAPRGLATPVGPIVVDDALRASLASHWAQTHPAPPTEAEMAELVARWIDQEVLYREGLARGLADGDAQVHDRVASQMAYVLQAQIIVPEPTDEQLRGWYASHAERWAKAERIDFSQVYVQGLDAAAEARARELLALLASGADPDGLGDTFSGGRRYRGRRIEDLTARFGAAFTAGLDTQPVDTWILRRSEEGMHLVRVDRRTAATAPDFDAVHDEVRHDWQQAQRLQRLDELTAHLRDNWDIVES
jgi:hypothetical protein